MLDFTNWKVSKKAPMNRKIKKEVANKKLQLEIKKI